MTLTGPSTPVPRQASCTLAPPAGFFRRGFLLRCAPTDKDSSKIPTMRAQGQEGALCRVRWEGHAPWIGTTSTPEVLFKGVLAQTANFLH
jgi:hypothetical protein